MTTNLTLSTDQLAAFSKLEQALSNGKREVVLVGAAGTGKSTVLRALLDKLDRPVIWAAPTGKAAARLAETTGEAAVTLHHLTYRKVGSSINLPPAAERAWKAYEKGGKLDPPNLDKLDWWAWYCRQQGRQVSSDLVFDDVQLPEGMKDKAGDTLVVVDEASMVGTKLAHDFRSALAGRSWQVLWVGDKAQLTPVNDDWGVDLDHPDAELTQVHRQAEGSGILSAATALRNGGCIPDLTNYPDADVTFGSPEGCARWYCESEGDRIILTYTNKVRVAINLAVRQRLGYTEDVVVGERLVVLQNRAPIYNGETYTVTKVERVYMRWIDKNVTFVTLDNGVRMCIDSQYLHTGIRTHGLPDTVVPVDYGYCLSIHKSQGSQWDHVCLAYNWNWLLRKDLERYSRLTYTAVTRAAKTLLIQQG